MIHYNETTILTILEWLWDVLAEPILQRLGYVNTPTTDEEWPRVWWCPTDILSLLPIHAAGYPNTDTDRGRSVIERVTSAYTSTIKSMKYSRTNLSPLHTGNIFVAAMPSTPNDKPLKSAISEALGILVKLRQSGKKTGMMVREKGVTVEDVYRQLPEASIAHFICHSVLDETNPSASKLLFSNGFITVAQISQLGLREGALAYLSACSTASIGMGRLEDEAITLSSAFQLAGFSRVVGTLWNAVDRVSHNVAMTFYEQLRNDPSRAAFALHRAVLEEREAARIRPSLWAPFLYTGA